MNQSSGCNNIFSASPSLPANSSCSSQSLQCNSSSSTNNNNINNSNSNVNNNERSGNISRASSCRSAASVDRPSHPAVIVSPPSIQTAQANVSVAHLGNDISGPQFETSNFYQQNHYVQAQQYFATTEAAAVACAASSPTVLQTPSFLPPYYGISPNLTDFNMFHMCYQPLLEIASPGTESSPTETLYGFANRLQPITSTGPHTQHFGMPQSYPQTRNGYNMASAVPRPGSAGKRGGRRPKECEEFDITLSEEEKDKRDKRRLRNKEAAARCRQRRIDLMGSLQTQVDLLKQENKEKDNKINQLQIIKNQLLDVIRQHSCAIPDSLRRTLDELANPYVPSSTSYEVGTELSFVSPQPLTRQQLMSRKRPPNDLVADYRPTAPEQQLVSQPSAMPLNANQINVLPKIKQELTFKTDPTLYDVNSRDQVEDEVKRPTNLFAEPMPVTSSNYTGALSTSGVPITTPSNINPDYSGGTFLEGPTGLTPMQPHSITAFTGAITPITNDGQNYATL